MNAQPTDSFPPAEESAPIGSDVAPMLRAEQAPLSEMGEAHARIPAAAAAMPTPLSDVVLAGALADDTAGRASCKVTESEERLRLALEGADLASWDVDLRTGLAMWNRQQVSQGIEPEGPISLELWRRRVHPEDLEWVSLELTKARDQRQPFALEHRILRADDGQLRWIALHGRFYYDEAGQPIRISGISRDITEQKETELRLAADLDAMTRLHSLSALSVVEGGTQAFLDQVLETALAITHADFGNVQLLDRETGELRIVAHRGFPDWWVEFWQSAATAHGSCGVAVAEGRRTIIEDLLESSFFANGPGLDIQLRAGIRAVQSTPLVSRSGARLGAISTHFKTPYKPDEHQLRLVDLLARQVADLIERAQAEEALRKAKTEAEAASAAKDKFIAALSHELRTPLMPVLIAASAYEDAPECPAEIRQVFSMIQHNVELEKQLIDDLLDVARITEGKMLLQQQVCDLHSIIWEAIRILRSELDGKKLDLRMELTAQNARVIGDARRLQQVLWNLMRNAIKFNPCGGLTILRSFQEKDALRLSITDTGIGIAAADLGRIFNAFEQSAVGATPRYGGLGLGLAISASIVAAHGGRIWAESEGEGQGATFHVALPIASATTSHPPDRSAPAAKGTRVEPLRILFVEDHEPTRTMLGYLLSRSGHQVKSTDNIGDALKLAGQYTFDLLISDIGLPDGDGRQLMRELQDRYRLSGIALSGFGMDEDIRRSSEAGFATHLVKPVTIQMVEAALDKLLQPMA